MNANDSSNELPQGFADLLRLALDEIDGLTDHEARLGIKQWTAARLQALHDDAKEKKRLHKVANDAEDAVTTARKLANSNAKGFIATARRMLVDDLGPAPNRAWEDAGWPPGSTAAPDTIEGRQKLLEKLAPWLAARPDKEVANKGFTAARGAAILTALSDALRDLPKRVGDRVKADGADTLAEKALRKGMSGLADELGSLLPEDSADYYYFGLVPPANPAPPAALAHLEAHALSPTALVAGCDRGPRAQRFVFSVQVVGRDAAPVPQEARREPTLTLEGLPAGAVVRISAHATNAAGRGAESAIAEAHLA